MASNASVIADEDFDYEDWIELYNHGEEAVGLAGFSLSDNSDNPFKWVFPDYIIQPGEFILVWASGKDRKPVRGEYRRGLNREVFNGITGTAVSDLTSHPNYPGNPSSRNIIRDLFEAPVNVGNHYGQRLHGWIKAPATGQYTFWVSGDDNCELHLSTSSRPEDVRLIARVPGWTNPRQWDKYAEQRSAPVTLQAGKYYYVMALMKEHEGGDHLAVGWQLPDGRIQRPIPGEYLFRGQAELHSNFSISAAGEEVILTDPSGNRISELLPMAIPTDVSAGRVPDGLGEWFFFDHPTPGAANTTQAYNEILPPPQYSRMGGFYAGAFDLSLSHPDENVQIIYTTDGSVPDPASLGGKTYSYKNQYPQNPGDPFGNFLTNSYRSFVVSGPIRIYNRSSEPNKLASISTTYHRNPWYFPSAPVRKGMVIRAKATKPGALSSKTVTHSFFVGQDTNPHKLPLISIGIQEDALFDYYDGIYVAGKVFDDWRIANPGSGSSGGTPANYWLGGVATEKPAHLEFFKEGGISSVLSQGVGIRMHGGWSKAFPMKSLRLYARAGYGTSSFNYPFFDDLPYDSFKRLILRNSGNDYTSTFIRDAAMQTMVSHLRFDTQACQPAVVYINGEFWGIHNMRERYDKHYLQRVYGVDPENLDLLENNAGVYEGSAGHYNAMLQFIQGNPLNVQSNYEYVNTQMDVGSFLDYQIANIFFANTDWPGNNIKFWRLRTDQYEPSAPLGHDGRWRWLMYDTDFGFAMYGPITHNTLQFATASGGPGWPNPPWSTYLLRRLLENGSFRNDFIVRFADLLNTAFLTDRVTGIINGMRQAIEPEMPEHIVRWRSVGNMNTWYNQINVMVSFANQRPALQRGHIRSFFNIASNISVSVDVNTPEGGYIRVNTIDISPVTPGVPQNPYPWSGTYFQGIPLEIEAIPARGYVFSHWEGAETGSKPLLNMAPRGNVSVKAFFERSGEPDSELIHYWHFNDLPSGTLTSVEADFSVAGDAVITYPGTGNGYMDRRTHRADDPVSNLNLQAGQEADQGAVLRVRNPADTRSLVVEAPSSGYQDITVAFAGTRTDNGATRQEFYYSVDGGSNWVLAGNAYMLPELPEWELYSFDLSGVAPVNDNDKLMFRIVFTGDNTGGDSGNNRFDNFSVSGIPLHSTAYTFPERALQVSLWPNPAIDYFIFGIDEPDATDGILRIYHMNGTLLEETGIRDRYTQINTTGLVPGVYLISFTSQTTRITKRLIKQ